MWWLMFGGACLLCWGAESPWPLAIAAAVFILTRWVERPLVETIVEAGESPIVPPMPTTATRAAGCVLWLLVVAMGLLFVAMAFVVATEGW